MPEGEGKLGISVLASGSSGNATILQYGGNALLIDAGLSCRELVARMGNSGCNAAPQAILITHEHTDHVRGLASIAKKFKAVVYGTRPCFCAMQEYIKTDSFLKKIFLPGATFQEGPFQITPFSISHDACDAVGYVIEAGDRKFAIATDLGRSSAMVEYHLRGCDAMILESNHDLGMLAASSRPWRVKQRILSHDGHLSNLQFADLFEKVVAPQTKTLILGHISRECNTYDLAENAAKKLLAKIGRDDINLLVGRQDNPLPTIWI